MFTSSQLLRMLKYFYSLSRFFIRQYFSISPMFQYSQYLNFGTFTDIFLIDISNINLPSSSVLHAIINILNNIIKIKRFLMTTLDKFSSSK